jgi:hypothetical protein
MKEEMYAQSDAVYVAFGKAAHVAQLLEKELIVFLLLPELQKTGKISSSNFTTIQAKLEKCPLGPLINKAKDFVKLDPVFESMCEEIKTRRIDLIHHYFTGWNALIEKSDAEILADLDRTHFVLNLGYKLFFEVNRGVFEKCGLSPGQFFIMLKKLEEESKT